MSKKNPDVIWFYDCKVIKVLQITIQPNFEVVHTLSFSLLDHFMSFLQCTVDNQWYLSISFYLADSKVLDVSTKIEYIAQNHHC